MVCMSTKALTKPAPDSHELMKRANFHMTPAMLKALDDVAAIKTKPKKKVTAAEVVRLAVRSYVRKHGITV